ncbi:outer membrane beta-barrel protein [Hymenobacter sp. M29]|uniref:Outer membrane beta-barrel protein n=1 Tax=Hymenobacter mellowenesis TaxID=3063995 RepID=A0ABT9ABN0_9BACT|nr:outer membrane beta-barrel protein [Hymenobacter sp. M29]MDO7846812.1 outer membrane beta-barrel protein [Hymenobacter sp. M29]
MNRLLCTALVGLAGGLRPADLLAQTTFSWVARLGGTLATRHYFDDNTRVAPGTYRPGFEAGVVGQLGGTGHWAGRAGVLYTQKGDCVRHANTDLYHNHNLPNYGDYTLALRLHYLTLPVSAVYAPRGMGRGLQLSFGGYLAACLGGNYALTNTAPDAPYVGTETIVPVWRVSTRYVLTRVVDAGAQAGVGYRRGAFLAQAEYSLGLVPVAGLYFGRPYYNGTGHLSLAYWFGPKG